MFLRNREKKRELIRRPMAEEPERRWQAAERERSLREGRNSWATSVLDRPAARRSTAAERNSPTERSNYPAAAPGSIDTRRWAWTSPDKLATRRLKRLMQAEIVREAVLPPP